MPIVARDILDVGISGYGMLLGASSIGQVLGSLLLSNLSGISKGTVAILSAGSIGFLNLIFPLSHFYFLSLAIMVLIGVVQSLFMTTTSTLLVSYVPKNMRGLVQGVRMQVGGGAMIPFGSLITGAIAAIYGAPLTLGLLGTLFGLSILAIAFLSKLRSLK